MIHLSRLPAVTTLDIAQSSSEGAESTTICVILEQALSSTWAKIITQPNAYVMTRDEFAVFNHF